MGTSKDKKPVAGWYPVPDDKRSKKPRYATEKPDGVHDLYKEIGNFRRHKDSNRNAQIDGSKKNNVTISFDTADKLAEQIAALRKKNNG